MDNEDYLALWGAVLVQAMDDVIGMRTDRCSVEQRMSAIWIFSNSVESRSFLWACEICSVDPERVRRMLRG